MKAFKLGKMTVGAIFKKPETTCYPAEALAVPEGKRGGVSCAVEQCLFCGMCARVCPADAIEVDREEGAWAVCPFSCVQCGSCVEHCPANCLSMTTDNPHVSTDASFARHTGVARA